MKAPTEKQRQWLWFVLLWCGGIIGTLLLTYAIRFMIRIA
jgi:hypothetical protein